MLLRSLISLYKSSACFHCRIIASPRRLFSQELEKEYTDDQKEKILEVMNQSDDKEFSRYDITKSRIKKIAQWKGTYGQLRTIEEIKLIDGFANKYAKKLYDSILKGPETKQDVKTSTSRIRGQIVHPTLSESVRQKCTTVLALYVSVNSVCWTLINRENYKVLDWDYYGIDYPDSKKLQITDILEIAFNVTQQIPHTDVYVMKAEPTTLRASGSDPNNPKVLAVNLQKSQMISMIIALISSRSNQMGNLDGEGSIDKSHEENTCFSHKFYFLRPNLPYRLYGTLVGNEKVSTDQTVEQLLQNMSETPVGEAGKCVPNICEDLKSKFRSQNELQRDMLGHCMLLALTFMDLCIYKKQASIDKLIKRGE